jgi:rod shape-determining protein MreC
VGQAAVVRDGTEGKEIFVSPSGFQGGLDEVLIVLEGVHQLIPEQAVASSDLHMMAPPPSDRPAGSGPAVDLPQAGNTDADRLKSAYKKIGDAQGHVYGAGAPPNFNIKVAGNPPPAAKPAKPAEPEPGNPEGAEVHLDQPDFAAQEQSGTSAAPASKAPAQQPKAKATKPAPTSGGVPRETR